MGVMAAGAAVVVDGVSMDSWADAGRAATNKCVSGRDGRDRGHGRLGLHGLVCEQARPRLIRAVMNDHGSGCDGHGCGSGQ